MEKKVRKKQGETKAKILKFLKFKGVRGAFVDNTKTKNVLPNSLNAKLGISAQLANKLLKSLIEKKQAVKLDRFYFHRKAKVPRALHSSGVGIAFLTISHYLIENDDKDSENILLKRWHIQNKIKIKSKRKKLKNNKK